MHIFDGFGWEFRIEITVNSLVTFHVGSQCPAVQYTLARLMPISLYLKPFFRSPINNNEWEINFGNGIGH